MPFRLPPEQTGAAAWYGPEMSQREDWLMSLTAAEIAEVEAAAKPLAARNAEIAAIAAHDFPLPTVGPKLKARVRDEVLNGRGFLLLRGLPVERWSMREAATAFFGLGEHLGSAHSQNGKGHVLGHVQDLGLDSQDPNVRIYQTSARQTFHTDSCDVVGLLCLKTARSGGLSALVSSTTIFNEMRRRRTARGQARGRAAWGRAHDTSLLPAPMREPHEEQRPASFRAGPRTASTRIPAALATRMARTPGGRLPLSPVKRRSVAAGTPMTEAYPLGSPRQEEACSQVRPVAGPHRRGAPSGRRSTSAPT